MSAPTVPSVHPPAHPIVGGLRAEQGKLIDETGYEVRLTGISWFGLETTFFAPHGLNRQNGRHGRNWQEILDSIAQMGFNTLRLPYCNQLFDSNSVPPDGSIDYDTNPDLKTRAGKKLQGLEIMDRIIGEAGLRGLKVILDRHQPVPNGLPELCTPLKCQNPGGFRIGSCLPSVIRAMQR